MESSTNKMSATEILDTSLNVLKSYGPFKDLHSSRFNEVGLDPLIIARAWKKLEKDGFAYVKETEVKPNNTSIRFYITFDGVLAIENCPLLFKGRPYRWQATKNKLEFLWKIVSLLAIVINGLVILAFAYLTYIKT
jgi:hypothetical protein